MIKGILLGIILGIAGVAAGVYLYFSTGRAPVAVKAPAMPFERKLANIGMHAYLDKLPHPEPQVPADEKNLFEGAKVYGAEAAATFQRDGSDGRRSLGKLLEGGKWDSHDGDAEL